MRPNCPGQLSGGERDHAQHVGARLEQELRAGVEQHAGDEKRECGPGHHLAADDDVARIAAQFDHRHAFTLAMRRIHPAA